MRTRTARRRANVAPRTIPVRRRRRARRSTRSRVASISDAVDGARPSIERICWRTMASRVP
ncbi:MAG: hypothetical protein A3K59_01500 [Euryarchaeota archaeon RBG_19FT_COMBO_69_17]|nr:MAG: hypothetical protein A3K59_01500 [Euryarchaeota archaeon RBG_19FT_COMBO_69_17]